MELVLGIPSTSYITSTWPILIRSPLRGPVRPTVDSEHARRSVAMSPAAVAATRTKRMPAMVDTSGGVAFSMGPMFCAKPVPVKYQRAAQVAT
jgi:hypothetical protein